MVAPGIEFTKVVDELNKRVVKFYVDVEVPVYYRTNAALNLDGSEGQIIAPIMYKLVASYNF
jgi:ferritin-like protein